MKKAISLIIAAVCLVSGGCARGAFDKAADITVITRESASGTRSAFVELFGVEQENADKTRTDKTVPTAITNDKTGVVLASVARDENAVGYISLGSLNDTVKALKIDGVAPTAENIANGSYRASRPFNIATGREPSPLALDFIGYILSNEGQDIVEKSGYIAVASSGAYSGTAVGGTLKIAGSSSVTPVMEKLKEAYCEINEAARIEINMTDSSSGMRSLSDASCDIAMVSREIKQSELDSGLIPYTIAADGIAVIVNKSNPLDNLTTDGVRAIYTGEAVKWLHVPGAVFE